MLKNLKKFWSTIFLAVFCLVGRVSAQGGIVPADCQAGEPCNYVQFLALLNNFINFLATSALVIATIIIVIAGINYVLVPTDPGRKGKAKNMLIGAVWGLILTLSAYLVIKFIVTSFIGGEDPLNLKGIFS